MTVDAGPTMRRVRLGKLLAEARKAAKKSREDAAAHAETSVSTVMRWETGKTPIKPPILRFLLAYYGMDENNELFAQMLQLAKEGRQRGWYAGAGGGLRDSYRTLLGLEEDTLGEEEFAAVLLPGLLQTRDYARSVHLAAVPTLDDAVIEERLKVRDERQERFFGRDEPAELHVVLDAGCVLRKVGGDQVWRAQLRHLVAMSEQRRVTIQVVPFDVGAHAETRSTFLVLRFAEMGPVAYLEDPTGDIFAEGTQASQYRERFTALRTVALPPTQSVAWIQQVANAE